MFPRPTRDDDYTAEAVDRATESWVMSDEERAAYRAARAAREEGYIAPVANLDATNVPELTATVRHKDALLAAHTGRGKSYAIGELDDAVEALTLALIENGLSDAADFYDVLDIAHRRQTISSVNARLAAAALAAQPSPEEEQIAALTADERVVFEAIYRQHGRDSWLDAEEALEITRDVVKAQRFAAH